MNPRSPYATLLADIHPGRVGGGAEHVLDGWGPPEGAHRWTIGQTSRIRLPISAPGADIVVVLHMSPWCDPTHLPMQAVSLSLDDRLLSTVQLSNDRVLALRLPEGIGRATMPVLGFSHLSSGVLRPQAGRDADGAPLGLMVVSIRLFRVPVPAGPPLSLAASLQQTDLDPSRLVECFETLGQDCEFSRLQRHFGAEPLALLRFCGLFTQGLVDGLMQRFEGVGNPAKMQIDVKDNPEPEYRIIDWSYFFWYFVPETPATLAQDQFLQQQSRRLVFLQRKFLETLRDGEKIFVLTRAEAMTEAEALAVFCALNLEGPNTLLWTTHGEPQRTGQVDCLMPGFLRGHLGAVNHMNHASPDAWLSVLANAREITRKAVLF